MIAPFFYWLAGFAAIGLTCIYAAGEKARQSSRRLLLIYVSSFVLWALVFAIGTQGRLTRAGAIMESDRAEILLKLDTAFKLLESHWLPHANGVFSRGHPSPPVSDTWHEESRKILEASFKENPDSSALELKLAIVLIRQGKGSEKAEGMSLLKEQASRQDKQERQLAEALLAVFSKEPLNKDRRITLEKTIENGLPRGWYRDSCLLALYEPADKALYDKLKNEINEKAAGLLTNALYLLLFGFLVVLVGIIVIVVQLFLWPGRDAATRQPWQTGAAWDLKTVYVVFISWLATEIACGSLCQWLLKITGLSHGGPLASALGTVATYVVSNAPALFYIYWFACRPAKLSFTEMIGLKFHCGKLGPVSLALIGLATWCASVPLVILTCYIGSRLLGTQGSSNPIITLVMEAARSSNLPVIILFYLTLSVLAPLCEESLFRGFLYGNLRKRFGMGLSLLVSASLFAAAHLDPGAILPLLCLGLIFGFVYEQTKSLIPSMIAHGLWNSGSFTVILIIFGF